MLRIGPWSKFGLTIRWLKQDYAVEFPHDLRPPLHMPIVYGPVRVTIHSNAASLLSTSSMCQLCGLDFKTCSFYLEYRNRLLSYACLFLFKSETPLRCPNNCSNGSWHVVCLGRHLTSLHERTLSNGSNSCKPQTPDPSASGSMPILLPLTGNCPSCNAADLFWPALISHYSKFA
ncbi:unnamed protein product [Protopolystoma xenopodis]|uniref:Uncharacterized protein n=1 Tax=Protopolystoma xenopodis TaxID=117903 RepID=A0A448XSN5_9PLAT|nr:unnamed protein product [Protopolystoma xenopodis]